MNSVEDVVRSLESVSERLAEMAIDSLRSAVDDGRRERPADEKSLTQARRAVEKAIHLLSSIEETSTPSRD